MQNRKALAVLLALVLTLAMAVPAFAEFAAPTESDVNVTSYMDGAEMEIAGSVQELDVRMIVPTSAEVVFNPYGLTVYLAGKDTPEDTTDDITSSEDVVAAPAYIINLSNIPMQVDATVKGSASGGVTFGTSTTGTTKVANLKLSVYEVESMTYDSMKAVIDDSGSTSKSEEIAITTAASASKKIAGLASVEFSEDNVLNKLQEKAGTADAMAVAIGVTGDITAPSDKIVWSGEEEITVTVAFTFKPVTGT